MEVGANAPPIQAQTVRAAGVQAQSAANNVNATPAGQGTLGSAVMSAQAMVAPPPVAADPGSSARVQPGDTSGQLANTGGAAASNATAATQAPVAVGPVQEPGTGAQDGKTEEKSADLPTEVVAALSGDDEGRKRRGEQEEGVEEVEEGMEDPGVEFPEPDPEATFADLLAQIEPGVAAISVRDVGTLFGRGKAARAYGEGE